MHMYAVPALALASAVSLAMGAPPADPPAASPSGSPAVSPPAGDAEVAALRDLVKNLQSQVDELKAENDDQWLTEKRADEIRGLVQEVLADADTRASLLQSGALAGYDKGFFISSADGNFLLRLYGQLQIRYVYNWREDSADDANRYGFEIRRAKIGVKGHVFDPSWQYDLLIAADRTNGNVQAEDNAWVQKDFGNGMKVKFGQFKVPYTREEILSSTRLFAVERSLVNSFFTAGTGQGVQVAYEADRWRLAGWFGDGANSRNTAWSVEDTEFALAGRFEYLAMGPDWKSNDQYDGFRGTDPSLLLGVAVFAQQAEYGTGNNLPLPDFNNNEVTNYGITADATYLANSWSVAGALFLRKLDPKVGSSLDQVGFNVRGGYFLNEHWELYGQYEWADADISGVEELSVLTFGVNRYFDKHNLKWQTDVGYSFDTMAANFAQDGSGWLPDTDEGEVVFRSQFQLLF